MFNYENRSETLFNNVLHHTLLCSDELEFGSFLRRKKHALKHHYIQFNDKFIKFLVLDIDRPTSALDWYDQNLPPPHFVVQNPQNGHCHYIYTLATPICKTDNARLKPLEFFAKIQDAYTKSLQADPCFAGVLTKNPNSQKWRVKSWATTPYELNYLADFVELPSRISKKSAIGEGRNCYLFQEIRKIAYREVLFYKRHNAKQDDFYNFLLNQLSHLNHFANAPSLGFNEVKAIAKSVSKWVWRNFSENKFSEIQSLRNAKRKIVVKKKVFLEELRNELS